MALRPRVGRRRGLRGIVRRAIFYRGLSRGGVWLGASVSLWLIGRIRGFFGREPEVLGTVKVREGASMALVTGTPPTRRDARRARRLAARASQ